MIPDTDLSLQQVGSSKPWKAPVSYPEQEPSFSCFSFLLKTEVILQLQTELTAQGFVIPVIIPKLLNSATCREMKAGLTVDV